MGKYIILALATIFMVGNVSAAGNETRVLALKTIEINGDNIQLSVTETKGGRICAQHIETIQFIAYGETAYTLGKKCIRKPIKLERS